MRKPRWPIVLQLIGGAILVLGVSAFNVLYYLNLL